MHFTHLRGDWREKTLKTNNYWKKSDKEKCNRLLMALGLWLDAVIASKGCAPKYYVIYRSPFVCVLYPLLNMCRWNNILFYHLIFNTNPNVFSVYKNENNWPCCSKTLEWTMFIYYKQNAKHFFSFLYIKIMSLSGKLIRFFLAAYCHPDYKNLTAVAGLLLDCSYQWKIIFYWEDQYATSGCSIFKSKLFKYIGYIVLLYIIYFIYNMS